MSTTPIACAETDREVERDLRTLTRFITLYCHDRHPGLPTRAVHLKNIDLDRLARRPVELCDECAKLLTHALVKRSNCSMSPKPACKHCPVHCYHPDYRAKIREVMKYSGKKILLSGRLDYLFHLIF